MADYDMTGIDITNLSSLNGAAVGGASELNDLTDSRTSNTSIGVGSGALALNSGLYNTAVGKQASFVNSTGNHNTSLGYWAMISNTTGTDNTAIGSYALRFNTGGGSVAVGSHSLAAQTTGHSNTAVGRESLTSNVDGAQNVAVGKWSLHTNTSGSLNTAVSMYSMYSNTTGTKNAALGFASLYDVTTGSNNSAIGNQSGRSSSPSGAITTQSNIICLGDNSVTALYCADTSISSSDGRDKTDVEDFTAGLDFITQMRPVTYRWDKRTSYLTEDNQDTLSITPDGTHKKPKQHIGFISQEVQALEQALGFATNKDNELICNTNEDSTAMGLKYERLVPILVNAIKELSAKVEVLENT